MMRRRSLKIPVSIGSYWTVVILCGHVQKCKRSTSLSLVNRYFEITLLYMIT